MSVPLLVATVFAATFLVVCAIAYVLLGRGAKAAPAAPATAPAAAPSLTPATTVAPEFDAPPQASYEIHAVRASTPSIPAPVTPIAEWAPPPGDSVPSAPATTTDKTTVLRLYRLLMFATGGTGILASWLMFSAVTEFSRLVVIAAVVFLLSCAAIYRGFVPDPELTGKKK